MPETPSERVALVVWRLAHREGGLSTREVAALTGLSARGAYALMCSISRVLPIYQGDDHVWQICGEDAEI